MKDETGAGTRETEPSLEELLREADARLDEWIDRLRRRTGGGEAPLRAVVRDVSVVADAEELQRVVASVQAECEEIEEALRRVWTVTEGEGLSPTTPAAVVPTALLEDPTALTRALHPLEERARFEFLFRQARLALDHLDPYDLCRQRPEELVSSLRSEEQLRRLQYVVEFLRALQRAAGSFESLQLPGDHIRDYLEHLYRMEDWTEMELFVGRLQLSVVEFLERRAG